LKFLKLDVKGEQGEGIQGPQGPQGIQGIQGIQGPEIDPSLDLKLDRDDIPERPNHYMIE
jgi:hypothetical protein